LRECDDDATLRREPAQPLSARGRSACIRPEPLRSRACNLSNRLQTHLATCDCPGLSSPQKAPTQP